MKLSKKIIAFNNISGVGVVRDARGQLAVLSNKKGGKNLSKGKTIFVTSLNKRDTIL